MGYLGFFIFFICMLQASAPSDWSEPSTDWDDKMYQERLAGPLQIGTATSWHTITKDVPPKTLSAEELIHARGMTRHLMTSLESALKEGQIKWRPSTNHSVLIKAIACVNQSEWYGIRDIMADQFRKISLCGRSSKELIISLIYIAKAFFVLGNTPKKYRKQISDIFSSINFQLGLRDSKDVYNEDFIPLCIMGIKFKRTDFPNSRSFKHYLDNRTSYRFDPGHFWITLQCTQLLAERFSFSAPFPLFKKLCEFEQPHFLIKLVQTPVPLGLDGDIDRYLQVLKDAPLDPQGPSGHWLKNVLLKRLECFQTRSDWSFEFEAREHIFRTNIWFDSFGD